MDLPETLSRLEKLEDALLAEIQEVRCIRSEIQTTEMRNRGGFARSQLTELQDTNADAWANMSLPCQTAELWRRDLNDPRRDRAKDG
jgi:hypothetical protein